MGWKGGKGLGPNLEGIAEPIAANGQADISGVSHVFYAVHEHTGTSMPISFPFAAFA